MKKINKKSELSNSVDFYMIVFIIVTFIAFFLIFKFSGDAYVVKIEARNRAVIGDFILNNYLRLESPNPYGTGTITNAELIALCVKDGDCNDRIIDTQPLKKYMESISDELQWEIEIEQGGKKFFEDDFAPSNRGRLKNSGIESEIFIPPLYSPNEEIIKVHFKIGYYAYSGYEEILAKI